MSSFRFTDYNIIYLGVNMGSATIFLTVLAIGFRIYTLLARGSEYMHS